MNSASDKLCHKCGLLLPLEMFPERKIRGKRVIYSPCQICTQMNQALWRQQNRSRLRRREREYMRRWRKANPGYRGRKTPQPRRHPATDKRYHDRYAAKPGVKEARTAYNRIYYARHRERILKQKRVTALSRALCQIGLDDGRNTQQQESEDRE